MWPPPVTPFTSLPFAGVDSCATERVTGSQPVWCVRFLRGTRLRTGQKLPYRLWWLVRSWLAVIRGLRDVRHVFSYYLIDETHNRKIIIPSAAGDLRPSRNDFSLRCTLEMISLVVRSRDRAGILAVNAYTVVCFPPKVDTYVIILLRW